MAEAVTFTSFIWAILTASFVVLIFSISKLIALLWTIMVEISPEETDDDFKRDQKARFREYLIELVAAAFVINIAFSFTYFQIDEITRFTISFSISGIAFLLIFLLPLIPKYLEGVEMGPRLRSKIILVVLIVMSLTCQIWRMYF